MYKEIKTSVVIPAYREQLSIGSTLRSIPDYIDKIFAVDDGSEDNTYDKIREEAEIDPRIVPIRHEKNMGLGATIVTGYERSLNECYDITVVLRSDDQKDLKYLPTLLDPIIENRADYAKGNKLTDTKTIKSINPFRRVGNFLLSFFNMISSGYWNISDSQNCYTAISRKALMSIDLNVVNPSYGYYNDILTKLSVNNFRVLDVRFPQSMVQKTRSSVIAKTL